MKDAPRYQDLAAKTEAPITPEVVNRLVKYARQIHHLIGMVTEVGELADQFKRDIYYGKPLDIQNIKEELGDKQWYEAGMCNAFDFDLTEIQDANIRKLATRYPEKFDSDAAINRDVVSEMKALESTL